MFSAVKRQNLRRLNSWRPPFLSSFLSPRPLPLPLAPLLGGGMSNSFYEFNVGCVQYQLLAVAAFASEESGDFHLHSRPGCRYQARLAPASICSESWLSLKFTTGMPAGV